MNIIRNHIETHTKVLFYPNWQSSLHLVNHSVKFLADFYINKALTTTKNYGSTY